MLSPILSGGENTKEGCSGENFPNTHKLQHGKASPGTQCLSNGYNQLSSTSLENNNSNPLSRGFSSTNPFN